MTYNKQPTTCNKGFTLIELMVSVAIFSVVMVTALGALLSMSEADRRAQAQKSVMNNLNFALESMSRTIRTGFDYNCGSSVGKDCINGGSSIYFTGADGLPYSYQLNGTGIERRIGTSGPYLALTAPEVIIDSLRFYVVGSPRSSTGDKVQPKVTILLRGRVVLSATQESEFNLQASVTQRLYDQ